MGRWSMRPLKRRLRASRWGKAYAGQASHLRLRRPRPRVQLVLAAVFVAATSVFLVWGIVVVFSGGHVPVVDRHCRGREFSCGIAAGVLTTLLPFGIALLSFLGYRFARVWYQYQRKTRRQPHRMLQAPRPDGGVVGRDDLCDVLRVELDRHEAVDIRRPSWLSRDDESYDTVGSPVTQAHVQGRRERKLRPIVLIGGVGSGKTAVLVRLTKLLGDRDVLPIPVRLRDAQTSLDFMELARSKFFQQARLVPGSDDTKVWRKLLDGKRIVIVADGLEEALTGFVEARETAIKAALEEVRDQDVPVVVASRPHDALNYLDVRRVPLESLASIEALTYIRPDENDGDPTRVQQIVERADVVEMPLFMEVARQLREKKRLDKVNVRDVGRLELRVDLLREWVTSLVAGRIEPMVALKPERRQEVIEQLESVACLGLLNDDLDVSFSDITPKATSVEKPHAHGDVNEDDQRRNGRTKREEIVNVLGADPEALRAVAADGARLRLVEPIADGVRFRHSTIQAYLGSRRITKFVHRGGSDLLRDSLRNPGRELLMAMEMACVDDLNARMRVAEMLREAVCGAAEGDPDGRAQNGSGHPPIRGWKAVSTAASAVSVHSLRLSAARDRPRAQSPSDPPDSPLNEQIDELIDRAWRNAGDPDTPTDEAKIHAIARISEASRYEALWQICCTERKYRVRMYAARKLGEGGLAAYEAVGAHLHEISRVALETKGKLPEREAAARELEDLIHAPSSVGFDRQPDRAYALLGLLLPQLFQSVRGEPDPPDVEHLEEDAAHLESDARETSEHPSVVAAHMKAAAGHVRGAASAARDAGDDARERAIDNLRELLKKWVAAAAAGTLYRTSEVALAQGFKQAANRRGDETSYEARQFLSREAERLLEGKTFWFTRMAVIQALTLWLLSEPGGGTARSKDACRKIDRWRLQSGHPFVEEAAELCDQAIRTGKPAPYIWIEEVDVVAKIGPSAAFVNRVKDQKQLDSRRWIPGAAGWNTLVPSAQQLVADVLVVLNLADRGRSTDEREENLDRVANHDLPPCVRHRRGREHLRVDRPLDDPGAAGPGSTCHSDCEIKLCPYPALGEELEREELGEAFCRLQQVLLRGRVPGRIPSWTREKSSGLREFWSAMELRRRL
jgi:hypothetical protein